MHWWQTPFSSSPSSSSSSSSSKHHSDDSVLNKILSLRSRAFRLQQRRPTKLRYRGEGDGPDRPRLWRSPSSLDQSPARSSPVVPHPLPLPELAALLRRDAASSNSNLVNIPLPSPKEPPSRGEERERTDDWTVDANGDGVAPSSGLGSKSACHESRKNKEHANTRRSRMAPQKLNGVEKFQDKYGINIPTSAPTSPFSSPAQSPQRSAREIFTSHYMSPQANRVWSAPEMPPLDMNLGIGFSYQMSPEQTAFSVDSSPLHSPRVSPHRSTRSPGGSPSPLHTKLSLETPSTWRDSNAQANVHPLPLPPRVTSPSQATSISQNTSKPELMPIKPQWLKGKLIGRGTFGSVYVGSNRETGALCAMKEVELFFDDPKHAESIKQLEQEIKVLSQLKHPNIVQYYGSEIIGNRFYIYLEYVHPGSINKYIQEHCGAITESVVRNFTRHILSGLAYLHSTKTIHRDIKGANLLVDAHGIVKLADFGMAKHLTGAGADLSLKGSPYWMAPELLQSVMQKDTSSDLALAVDIWSLGCTIIEMLNGKPPWSEYEGAAAMFKVLRETPPIPETLSSEGKDFLWCCFRRNPAERPSASVLLEHRFLKNSQQQDLPTCVQALNGMTLTDKAESLRELPFYKFEQLLASADAQTKRAKLANSSSFIHDSFSPVRPAQQPYHETSNLTVVPRQSPRSTLEALPS